MSITDQVTFAVAVNNREVFETNFLGSPCFRRPLQHQILVQEGFASATKAYNQAIEKSVNDLIVFCHQDIILPGTFLPQLQDALADLECRDPGWGVLGSYGKTADGRGWGHIYSSGLGVIGQHLTHPVPIQTLDEIVLVLRKSSGLRFDEQLPHFHMYGADICLMAADRGMRSYAISAFCIHNTHQALVLPTEFYQCCRYIRRKWKGALPIVTTCVGITRFNGSLYSRRLREAYLRYIKRTEIGGRRTKHVKDLLDEFGAIAQGS